MPASVLIVDDHADFRARVRQLLERSGFVVVAEAADGGAALTAARRWRPDVVLLDVQLPDTDGITLIPLLHRACPSTKVLLTSVREEATYGSRVRDCGAVGFLGKHELSAAALHRAVG